MILICTVPPKILVHFEAKMSTEHWKLVNQHIAKIIHPLNLLDMT